MQKNSILMWIFFPKVEICFTIYLLLNRRVAVLSVLNFNCLISDILFSPNPSDLSNKTLLSYTYSSATVLELLNTTLLIVTKAISPLCSLAFLYSNTYTKVLEKYYFFANDLKSLKIIFLPSKTSEHLIEHICKRVPFWCEYFFLKWKLVSHLSSLSLL